MRTSHRLAVAAAVAAILAAARAYGGEIDLPRYPSVSPDGSQLVFSWRGDLWGVAATGGHATRLTAHPGDDLRSAWSPDGRHVAFDSDRSGWTNLWVMDAGGGGIRQVTFEDTACVLSGWTPDGEQLLFHASREGDVYREPRPYRVFVEPDSGAIHRVHDAHGRAPRRSPDGIATAFTRGGSSWTRRGYRGPGAREVWIERENELDHPSFRRVTTWEGNDGLPRWQDDRRLLHLSDRELDTVNVWRRDVSVDGATAERLTSFQGTDVTWFDVSADGGTAVLTAWDRIYTLDLRSPGSAPRALTITAARDAQDDTFLRDVASDATEAALNPDGKSVACVSYGEVFVRGVETESPTVRVTADHARDKEVAWSPDGMTLYFVSDRAGHDGIYAAHVTETRADIRKALLPEPPVVVEEEEPQPQPPAAGSDDPDETDETDDEKPTAKKNDGPGPDRWSDAVSFTIEVLLVDEQANRGPQPSPDGTQILFRRGRGDLCVLDLASKSVRVLSPGWDTELEYRWSPDGRHVAFNRNDRNFNQDVWIVPSDGSADPVNVSRHPDDDTGPLWSADGRLLAFTSSRWDEQSDVYVVFLDRDLESLTVLERKRQFEEADEAAKKRKPLPPPGAEKEKDGEKNAKPPDDAPDLDLDTAYRRVRRVTSGPESEYAVALVPSGERVVYSDGKTLRSIKWDGTDDKQLRGSQTSVNGLSLGGDKLLFVTGGKPGLMNTAGGGEELLPLAAKIELRHADAAEQRFREAARVVGEVFYHPTMKGRDWPALTERYLELARRARTPAEFDEVSARLLGELNASHLGIRSPRPDAPNGVPNGRLGIDFMGGTANVEVSRVLADGPADRGPLGLRRGDWIVSVDGRDVSPDQAFDPVLRGTVGREIVVEFLRRGDDGQQTTVRVLLTPISAAAENELRYQDWVRSSAERVAKLSDGRIGYVHIRGMNEASLRVFERELYAAMAGREGLIVDVRNNGGGSTADLVLASLMVRPHAYTVPRGADPQVKDGYPEDRLYIQRFTGPVNMLCNEKSFSNAEIVSHAFKTLRRGTLVGEQTYGGVISTGGYGLVDGTFVRTPFRGWYLPDGTDMENNGAMPDIRVPPQPDDEAAANDAQLDAAVRDVLTRVPR